MTTQPDTIEATATLAAATCPNCGGDVPPRTRGLVKHFCKPACRAQFWARWQKRGQVAIPLLAAQLATRHATEQNNAEEADLCSWARQQYTEMVREWRDEDAEAGRPPVQDYVAAMRATGFMYADRRRS